MDDTIVAGDRTLALYRQETEPVNLFTVRADGSRFRWITTFVDHDVRATQPTWTPDGSHILFTHVRTMEGNPDGLSQLAIIDPDRAQLGGGILNHFDEASTMLSGSTVSGNSATDQGGGIWNSDVGESPCSDCGGTVALDDSTITGNSAGDEGGGVWNEGDLTLDAISAVTGNTPDDCVGNPAC